MPPDPPPTRPDAPLPSIPVPDQPLPAEPGQAEPGPSGCARDAPLLIGPALYAEVAVNAGRPLRQTFTYAVPADLGTVPSDLGAAAPDVGERGAPGRTRTVAVGQAVFVPFGRKVVQGVVLALRGEREIAAPRPLLALIDSTPMLTTAQAALARWMSDYYLASLWACVSMFLPRRMSSAPLRILTTTAEAPADTALSGPDALSDLQRDILTGVARLGPIDAAKLTAIRDDGPIDAALEGLVRRGLVAQRYTLARAPGPPQPELELTLALPRLEAEAALRSWPQSKRSRKADLLERLQAGPAPYDEARRIVRSRESIERWLREAVLVVRESDPADADVVRLAPRFREHPAAADAAILSLRRTARERRGAALLDALLSGPRPAAEARAEAGADAADVEALIEQGLIRRHVVSEPPAQMRFPVAPVLTAAQARAYGAVSRALDEAQRSPGRTTTPRLFLLHGVTGSGKTEVYLAAAERVREQGGVTLVLVPEIALAPQTVDRFRARMPGRVTVLHSALSPGELEDHRRRIREGEVDVVIGSRSALFAPVHDPTLIVVDEEHEWTYKQTDPAPRYHVREVVERYCELTGAVALLGSATPDLVTYARANAGRYTRLDLSDRVRRPGPGEPVPPTIPMPEVEIVDLREELTSGNRSIFSRALRAALEDTLLRGEQAMLFLNRRGAGIVVCRTCGEAVGCARCAIPLTLHAFPGPPPASVLRCHECGYRAGVPARCPVCDSDRIRPMGLGTERLEAEVTDAFPLARPLRWDRDTVRGRDGHRRLLELFRDGVANVLIGTQLIAKGLDLPQVTLVGVINADLSLRLPDYTNAERTFQLITQVAGRAGRGLQGGRVIVQSYAPDHPVLVAAAQHDYEPFAAAEIAARAAHDYPPTGRLARLVYADRDRRRAQEVAATMAQSLVEDRDRRGLPGPEVLGPTPAFISRRRELYRQQITLRGDDPHPLLRSIDFPRGWTVDIDPVSLL